MLVRLQYIAVEGVIGVGKTSLAKKLAKHFNGKKLLEGFEENPFLKDFYNNPRQFAFPTQLFFLLSRYRQQQDIPPLFHARVNYSASSRGTEEVCPS